VESLNRNLIHHPNVPMTIRIHHLGSWDTQSQNHPRLPSHTRCMSQAKTVSHADRTPGRSSGIPADVIYRHRAEQRT
jgi:hypothetical protein